MCVYIFIYIYTDWNPPAFENHLEMNFGLFLLTIPQSIVFWANFPFFPGYFLPSRAVQQRLRVSGKRSF